MKKKKSTCPMNMRALASYLCFEEGGKSEIKVGDMRQILNKISELVVKSNEIGAMLYANGLRIINKKKTRN